MSALAALEPELRRDERSARDPRQPALRWQVRGSTAALRLHPEAMLVARHRNVRALHCLELPTRSASESHLRECSYSPRLIPSPHQPTEPNQAPKQIP